MESENSLKMRIREELPHEAFLAQPQCGLLAIPILGLIIALTYTLIRFQLPWYLSCAGAFLLGNIYASFIVLGHDVLHGSVFRVRWLQDLIAYPAFLILCFPPSLWRVWHNQVHHGKTNMPDVDPDSFSTLARLKRHRAAEIVSKGAPGSGHWMSLIYLLYSFTCQGQLILWIHSKHYETEFKQLNRRRAIIESLLIVSFWVVLALYSGPRGATFGVIIPMAVANFVCMSYISTHHQLRPLTVKNDPLENSMSVSTFKWIDFLHLNFSHHVEHHLFPSMNWRFTPLVRKSLQKYARDRFLSPPHWKALWWIYHSPRTYLDEQTFVNPLSGRTITVKEIEARLRDPLSSLT